MSRDTELVGIKIDKMVSISVRKSCQKNVNESISATHS